MGRRKGTGAYTVSQDRKSGAWYCHQKGYPHIPVFGSISDKKWVAMEYMKMKNDLPHKVEQIENERREAELRFKEERNEEK